MNKENNRLSNPFFKFIETHFNDDPIALRLKSDKSSFDFDLDLAITQIICRKKHISKFSNFICHKEFLFPDELSAEQASHQAVGRYHASLTHECRNILDMTAGLGIDSLSFASRNISTTSVELNSFKADILKKNSSILNIDNIDIIKGDSVDFLRNTDKKFDLIFVDPSRRDDKNGRLYNLLDCSPDIISNQELLFDHSDRILIKASPLLDISRTIKDFPTIQSIHAVGVKGECKEILIELSSHKTLNEESIKLHAIDLDNNGDIFSEFSFNFSSKGFSASQFSEISDLKEGVFVLEPSAMLMKFSPWNIICERFSAKKLGKSSHIFISDGFPADFPGRVTKFERFIKKPDRKSLAGFPASVVSRNYPLSSDEIRKSIKLKEGDKNFIYASRLGEKPVMFLTSAISEPISG